MFYFMINDWVWYRKNTRRSTDHDQGRQGEHKQTDCRDRRPLHHRHGQTQTRDEIDGRSSRRTQGRVLNQGFKSRNKYIPELIDLFRT